jgi:hypothetical protein
MNHIIAQTQFVMRAIDYTRTGKGYSLYLLGVNPMTGAILSCKQFEGMTPEHNRKQIIAIAASRGLERTSPWSSSGHECSLATSALSHAQAGYASTDGNNPHLWSSDSWLAFEVGYHMKAMNRLKPESYKGMRGQLVECNLFIMRCTYRKDKPRGIVIERD